MSMKIGLLTADGTTYLSRYSSITDRINRTEHFIVPIQLWLQHFNKWI